ncbi:cyclin, partial [Baffinella frigidus]
QRKILIDWLVDVQTHFTMCQETLHNTVSLVDRVWAVHRDLPPRRIQAMGAACLFISAKFNETY